MIPRSNGRETTILVESRSNRLGIEIEHYRGARGAELLRAYRCGRLVLERPIMRDGARVWTLAIEVLDARLSRDQRAELELALDEGLRVLRDGRGLCECA
jgi:hypothetical protein